MLELDTSDWKTIKLKINWGSNVIGDVCSFHEKTARHLVAQGYAEPVGWTLDGNGKDKEIVAVVEQPQKAKRRKSKWH